MGKTLEQINLEANQRAAAKAAQKEKLLENVTSWDILVRDTTDEGGKTQKAIHTFVISGQTLEFVERNVFDFGRVINPCYAVAGGFKPGGMATKVGGKWWWETFGESKGWYAVRPLTAEESTCIELITGFGKFAKSWIRM